MLTILGTFVYSGRGWGYTASMLYPKFRKEMMTGILCGKMTVLSRGVTINISLCRLSLRAMDVNRRRHADCARPAVRSNIRQKLEEMKALSREPMNPDNISGRSCPTGRPCWRKASFLKCNWREKQDRWPHGANMPSTVLRPHSVARSAPARGSFEDRSWRHAG